MKQLHPFLVAVFFAFVGSAVAQPANDNFVDRFTLSGLLSITNGTTVCATFEAGEPPIFNDGDQTAWYEWVAPASVTTTLRAGGGNNQRTVHWMSSSSCGIPARRRCRFTTFYF